jgi:hypothetical protein
MHFVFNINEDLIKEQNFFWKTEASGVGLVHDQGLEIMITSDKLEVNESYRTISEEARSSGKK